MSYYRTIKELVIETCMAEGGFPSYEKLTSLVRQHFPTSKWQKTHYAWYKSKIKTGEIQVPGISAERNEESDPEEIEAEVEESIEASVSLEKDLHSYLAASVSEIESGLSLVENGIEYQTEAGRIDLLARDGNNQLVVIELKAGKAKDNALGQLLGYIGCLSVSEQNVRGILIASSFDSRVVFAARGLANVKLVKYQLSFNLQETT
ncbi:MAG: endonuclease NucS [Acidobacteriota bacterium]|nr:endonuclease NucS [Acidobacteriota bacterium]